MQERRYSSALAMKLRLSCINPLKYPFRHTTDNIDAYVKEWIVICFEKQKSIYHNYTIIIGNYIKIEYEVWENVNM